VGSKCSQCRQCCRAIHCLTCSDLLSSLCALGSHLPGCIGQLSSSASCFNTCSPSCGSTLSCPPVPLDKPLYLCPLNHGLAKVGGGNWASFGCQGQIGFVNKCINNVEYKHKITGKSFACSLVNVGTDNETGAVVAYTQTEDGLEGAPVPLFLCPVDHTLAGPATSWASYGCLGQYSSVATCTNDAVVHTTHHKYTAACTPVS
jgi:hypothetical protein